MACINCPGPSNAVAEDIAFDDAHRYSIVRITAGWSAPGERFSPRRGNVDRKAAVAVGDRPQVRDRYEADAFLWMTKAALAALESQG